MSSDELERRLRTALAAAVADVDPPGPGPAALRRAAAGAAPAHRLRRVLLPGLAAAAVLAAAGITVAVNQAGGGPRPTVPTVPAGTNRPSAAPSATTTRPSPSRDESSSQLGLLPLCTPNQVSLSYHAGNRSGGADSGLIAILDTGASSCRLKGAITVEPVDANGKVIPTVPGWSNTVRADIPALSGNGTVSPAGEPKPGMRWAQLVLAGQYTHGNGPNGTCPAADEVTPAAWRVTGAVTGTVRNADPATDSLVPDGLRACDSGNGLDLEKVLLAYPPPTHPLPTSTGTTYTGSNYHGSAPPSACRQDDLHARYVGGGNAGSSHIGQIVVWNTGSQRCALLGPLGFAGYYADGSRDRAVQMTDPLDLSTTLPARMAPFRDRTSMLRHYLVATVSGMVIDASGRMCDMSDPTTAPARFVLTIGPVSLSVANSDPDAVQNQVLHGCGGRILLEGFSTPTGG